MQSCGVVARLRVACLNMWYFSKELLLELSVCSMYPILYRMPSLAKPETLEAPLCVSLMNAQGSSGSVISQKLLMYGPAWLVQYHENLGRSMVLRHC